MTGLQRAVNRFLEGFDLDNPDTIPVARSGVCWDAVPEEAKDEIIRYEAAFGTYPRGDWRKQLSLLEYGKELSRCQPEIPEPPAAKLSVCIDAALARIRKRAAYHVLESLIGSARIDGAVFKVTKRLEVQERETLAVLKPEIAELLRGGCADWFK